MANVLETCLANVTIAKKSCGGVCSHLVFPKEVQYMQVFYCMRMQMDGLQVIPFQMYSERFQHGNFMVDRHRNTEKDGE